MFGLATSSSASVLLPLALLLAPPVFAQTSLILEDDPIFGVGIVEEILDFDVNDSGEWIARVRTNHPDIERDVVVIKNGVILFREGTTVIDPLGLVTGFDSINLNSSSASCFTLFFEDGAEVVAVSAGNAFLSTGDISGSSSLPMGTHYSALLEARTNDTNDALLLTALQGQAPFGNPKRALVVIELDARGTILTERIVAVAGVTYPGLPSIGTFHREPTHYAFNDSRDVAFKAELSQAGDLWAIYLNDTELAREGTPSPVPGRNWETLSAGSVDLNDNRDVAYYGVLGGSPTNDGVLIRNTEVAIREGMPLDDPALGSIQFLGGGRVRIANTGEVIYWATVSDAPEDRNTGLFADGEILLQEGVDTVNGFPFTNFVRDAFESSPNGRYLLFRGGYNLNRRGLFLHDRGELAHQEVRNGRGSNAFCLSSAQAPVLGAPWPAHVDFSAHPGATFAVLFAHSSPIDGLQLPFGELLVDVGSPQLSIQSSPVPLGDFTIDVPNDPNLVGASGHIQALIVGGGSFELCNAIQPTAGS